MLLLYIYQARSEHGYFIESFFLCK